MRVVLDCNVLISAGLNPGICQQVLLTVTRSHQCIVSAEILREYVSVVRRPRFSRAQAALIDLIQVVNLHAAFVTPDSSPFSLPDPKDQPYLDAALAGGANVIITGNKKHFPAPVCQGVRILSPREFLDLIRAAGETA